MAGRYDAIVIGAGNGGLSAAALLASRGAKVLLLEQHNVPGGYATSFVRGRYEFEVALHQLSGIGPPGRRGQLYRYLEQLGMLDRLELHAMESFHRSVFPDLDVTLPVGREAYEQAMCEAFPAEADGIRRYLDNLFAFHRGLKHFQGLLPEDGSAPPLGGVLGLPFRAGKLLRHLLSTLEQVMARDVRDERARAVLAQTWMYYGLPPSTCSYVYFASGTADFIGNGPWYVKGRSQALSNAFASRIEELGGEVRTSCGAKRITTRDGRVTGVITEHDEALETGCVVANVNPVTTCRELIGAEHVPAGFWRRLRSTTIGPSAINVFLGLAKDAKALGLDDVTFINLDYDLENQYRQAKTLEAPSTFMVTCHNVVLPEMSPPGTAVAVLTTMAYGDAWYGVPSHEYVATKSRIAEAMLEVAERTYPGLREAIEVVEVATPVTNMRYTGALGGAIYGFDEPATEVTAFRLPQRGPVGGLYFAGAWTQPGGGFEPTIFSGRTAGAMALRRIRRQSRGS